MSHNRHVSVSSNPELFGTASLHPRSADPLLEKEPPSFAPQEQSEEYLTTFPLIGKTKARRAPVILVVVDLTRFSCEALKTGMRLAAAAKGELVLFHAVHLSISSRAADVTTLTARLQKEAREELQPLLAMANSASVKASCAVHSGPQAETILKTASQLHADMIVLGAGRRGFWSRLFSDRTCERVIRGARCPVFVVNDSREKNFAEI